MGFTVTRVTQTDRTDHTLRSRAQFLVRYHKSCAMFWNVINETVAQEICQLLNPQWKKSQTVSSVIEQLLTYAKYNWMIYPVPWHRGFGLLLVLCSLSDWKPDGYYSLSGCKSIPQKMKQKKKFNPYEPRIQLNWSMLKQSAATDEGPHKEITNMLNRQFLRRLKKKATQWLSVLSLRFRSVNTTEDLSSHILLPTNRQ